jgi:hypothetical protein
MKALTKEEFLAQWGAHSLEDLRAAAEQGGSKLDAKTKDAALQELYKLYIASTKEGPGVDYEGRCVGIGVFTRGRAGYRFSREWAPLTPSPTQSQVALLKTDKHIQIRLR